MYFYKMWGKNPYTKMKQNNVSDNISFLHWLSCSLNIGLSIVHLKIHINRALIHSTVSGF